MTRLEVPPPDAETGIAVAGNGEILVRHYRGPSAPKANLLLCHGNGFAIDAYVPFWAPLAADYNLFVFDLRHHGRNVPAKEWLTGFSAYAGDYDRIVEFVRAEAPGLPVIGAFHSVSAITAIYHAAHNDSFMDALVLFDPPLQMPEGHPDHQRAVDFEHKLADWARTRPRRFASPAELAAQFAGSRTLSGWVDGAHALMARSVLRETGNGAWELRCPPEAEAQNYLANAELTTWDLIDRVRVPLALVSADPDHPAGQSPAKVCAAAHVERNVPLTAIAGTTHMLQIEEPAACRKALADSLAALKLTWIA